MTLLQHKHENELLAGLRTGIPAAFRELFEAYWERVYAVCRKGTGSEADGEELAQDLFRALWERRASLDIHGPLENYLMRSAKHAVFNFHRYHSLRHQKLERLKQELAKSVERPDEGIERTQHRQELEEAIEALPPSSRGVFELSHRKGLTHKEIGMILGISPKTVEYHLGNARALLRKKLMPGNS